MTTQARTRFAPMRRCANPPVPPMPIGALAHGLGEGSRQSRIGAHWRGLAQDAEVTP